MVKKSAKDLTEGPILKNLILFALPIIASNLLQQFYSTADQIVVGKFASDTALAAVGATGHITNLIINLFSGLSVGATVCCAKHFGAKNHERLKSTVHTSIALSIVSGLILAVVGIVFAEPLLVLMKTPKADVLRPAVQYMSIIFAGVPFLMIYNFGAGILRAGGDTKRPFYILSISGLVNVIFNMIFVILFNWGSAGVAVATVISQALSAVAVIWILVKRDDEFKLVLKEIRLFKDDLLSIVRVGLPTGINASLYNVANISLQSTVNTFGSNYIAASVAASSISHYISHIQAALSTAAISFISQNYGAKKYKRVNKTAMISLGASFGITLALAVAITIAPELFLGLFTNNSEVVKFGVGKVIILCFGYVVNTPSAVLGSALRGLESPKMPMMINIVSICFSRLAWLWYVNNYTPSSFSMIEKFNFIFLCYPISWALSSIAMVVAYYWKKRNFPKTLE